MTDFIPNQAVVLFAHGSRDPQWRAPIEAVAARMQQRQPGVTVACAYLELCAPDLDTVVDQLVREGIRAIRLVPLFLGMGRHAREDLPLKIAALQARHPGVPLHLQPAVGADARLIDLLADIALQSLSA